jgi:transposase
MPAVLAAESNELTATCRGLLVESLQHPDVIERRIEEADARVRRSMSSCELCRKIGAIEGIGPLTATAVVAAVGDASAFKNGRHLAAWLGLVPRQHSSGGRSQLHGISKRGDTYLRTLLIHGARSVLRWLGEKQDAHSRWLRDLIERRGFNRAAVELANKNARIIQALLSSERAYRPRSLVAAPA